MSSSSLCFQQNLIILLPLLELYSVTKSGNCSNLLLLSYPDCPGHMHTYNHRSCLFPLSPLVKTPGKCYYLHEVLINQAKLVFSHHRWCVTFIPRLVLLTFFLKLYVHHPNLLYELLSYYARPGPGHCCISFHLSCPLASFHLSFLHIQDG